MDFLTVVLILFIAFTFTCHVNAVPVRRPVTNFVSLSLHRVEPRSDLHPHIIHQQLVNRAHLRLAQLTGSAPPTPQVLATNLYNRALALPNSPQLIKRFRGDLVADLARDWGLDFGLTGDQMSTTTSSPEDGYDMIGVEAFRKNSLTKANTHTNGPSFGLEIVTNDVAYVGTVQIGTPPRDFNLIMDTGSSDFFVASSVCKLASGGDCSQKHRSLGPSTSSSFNDTKRAWSVQYGTGAVYGTKVTDIVKIAGFSLPNLHFGVANTETPEFAGDQILYDGIMGFGHAELSQQHMPSILSILYNTSQIQSRVAGFRIPRLANRNNDGEMTLGGVDEHKFRHDSVVTLDNIGEKFWQAKLDSVATNGNTIHLNGPRLAVFDTGTTLIVAPPLDVMAIHQTIPGAIFENSTQSWTIPCTTKVAFSMTFGGKQFDVDPRDLLFMPVHVHDTQGACVSGITPGIVGGPSAWLVGDVFLKNVYFTIDEDQNRVSLAKLV